MEKVKNFFKKISGAVKKFKKKKWGGILWQLLTSILMLAIAGGIGIFLAVGKVKGGPRIFANEYFEYYSNRNWYNMYNTTEIKESKFINRNTFRNYMLQNVIEGTVKDFDAEVIKRDSEYSIVKITYTVDKELESVTVDEEAESQGSEKKNSIEVEGSYTMKLKRQPENILFFYTTWKGCVDDYIIENCTIEIPEYLNVTFDGMDISDCRTGISEVNGNAVYTLDRVFMGKHKIEISNENIDTMVAEVEWNESGAAYVLEEKDLNLKEEDKKNIKEQAINMIVSYYTTAFAGKNADSIKELVYADEAAHTHVDTQYKTMLDEINHEDGRTLISMEIASYGYRLEEYKYMESVSVVVEYTANYTAKKPRTMITGIRKDYNGTNTATAKVYFKYIDNEWKLTDADIVCIDYSVDSAEE